MDELKPCPFCGSKKLTIKDVWKTWRFVACECKAGGAPAKDDAGAISNWNRRADDADYTDALNRAAGKWAHADAENRTLRERVTDMHALLQCCCDGTNLSACIGDRCRM